LLARLGRKRQVIGQRHEGREIERVDADLTALRTRARASSGPTLRTMSLANAQVSIARASASETPRERR